MRNTMRTPKTLIAALGMSAFACGSAPADLSSGQQGVSNSSIAIHTMAFDSHQAKIGEFSAGYGVSIEVPQDMNHIVDVQAIHSRSVQTSQGRKLSQMTAETMGCETQLSSTTEGTTGILIWCDRNNVPANVAIVDQDDLTIRVYSKQAATAAEYQPSVRGVLSARAYGLRADIRIPASAENITHFRAYRASYNAAGTLMNRSELSANDCQVTLSGVNGYPFSEALVQCKNEQSVAAGEKIEIDYQTQADVLPATMRSVESQLVYSPAGFEATAYINTPASEILNLRAYRNTNTLDEDQSEITSSHKENYENRGCTVELIAVSKVQSMLKLECSSATSTGMDPALDGVTFTYAKDGRTQKLSQDLLDTNTIEDNRANLGY